MPWLSATSRYRLERPPLPPMTSTVFPLRESFSTLLAGDFWFMPDPYRKHRAKLYLMKIPGICEGFDLIPRQIVRVLSKRSAKLTKRQTSRATLRAPPRKQQEFGKKGV